MCVNSAELSMHLHRRLWCPGPSWRPSNIILLRGWCSGAPLRGGMIEGFSPSSDMQRGKHTKQVAHLKR